MSTEAPDEVSIVDPLRIDDYLLKHPDFQRALKVAAGLLAVAAIKVLMQHPAVRERMLVVAPELSNVRKTIDFLLELLARGNSGAN